MSWNMQVEYDSSSECVHVSFTRCVLVSREDVKQWGQELAARLSQFGRKVDLILNLKGMEVAFTAGRLFQQVRAALVERYAQRVCSYGGDAMTRMFFTNAGSALCKRRLPQANTFAEAVSVLARMAEATSVVQSPRIAVG